MNWLLSWAFYWIGDAIHRLQWWMPERPEFIHTGLFHAYQWVMRKCDRLGGAPWR